MNKRCNKCGEVKPLASFGVEKRSGNPLARCKSCVAANTRAWQGRNLERARATTKRWKQTERGKASNRATNRRYRERNTEKVLAYRRRWVQTENGQASCRRATLKWLTKNPDATVTGMISLDGGTLLDSIAATNSANPLDRLIQHEAVVEVAKRLTGERGCSLEAALAIVEEHA